MNVTIMGGIAQAMNNWNKVWEAAKPVGTLRWADGFGNLHVLHVRMKADRTLIYSAATGMGTPESIHNNFGPLPKDMAKGSKNKAAAKAAVVSALKYKQVGKWD